MKVKIELFIMIIILVVIGLVFFIFQNNEIAKKTIRNEILEENLINPQGAGITEISKIVKKEEEVDTYVVRTLRNLFSRYMQYISEENEEAILEINSLGNTYIESKNAKQYKIDEIYVKEQNYSYTFFISCTYANDEYYYLVDMDTSNKTFRFEEIDEETFKSAKNGSVSEKYDYKVFIKKGNYNTFKFDYSN